MREERIGNQRLILGDCLTVMPTLGPVDAVVTDPPYGIGFEYNSHDDGNPETYRNLMRAVMPLMRIAAPFCAVTTGMKHHVWWYCEFKPDYTMSWHKPNQCSRSPLGGFNAWEPILLFGKTKAKVPHDCIVQSINTAQPDTGCHPCPKDKTAWSRLVKMLTLPGDTILDPFMGSGTTLVACQKLGRHGIGIEIDPEYFEIACRRVEEAARQPDLFIEPAPKPQQEAMDL